MLPLSIPATTSTGSIGSSIILTHVERWESEYQNEKVITYHNPRTEQRFRAHLKLTGRFSNVLGITLSNHIIIFQNTMSLIAASQEDIDEGKHAALADLYFLLTLDASLVDAAEKQASKNELLEGIKKHSALKSLNLFVFFFSFFS